MSKSESSPRQPEAEIKVEQEGNYRLNLINNREAVIQALIEMEGERWFKMQETWGENSIDGALVDAQTDPSGIGIIYGFGGIHRYMVRKNGDVRYSESHGRSAKDKAVKLGFQIRIG